MRICFSFTVFLSLLFFTAVNAQHITCDGNRYRHDAFANVTTTLNVQYGQNYTMNNVLQNLIMDIAEPSGDVAAKRPLVIYIHSGGFVQGSRSEGNNFCLALAKKGFVTATIDYRLIDIPLTNADSVTLAGGLVDAISDAKAAIRFFVEDAATNNVFKIDTNYIFVSGLSAGAITADHVAYLDPTDNIPTYFSNLLATNGGFTGNSSTNTTHTTPIRGVVNASGALWRKDWMSVGEPPIYSAHDNMDTIVPCGHGVSDEFPFPVFLDGSCVMQQEANAKGIFNQVFINNSNGHGAYLQSSPLVDTVMQQISDFLYELICTAGVGTTEISNADNQIQPFPNPADETVMLSFASQPDENSKLEIYNAIGILILKIPTQQTMSIDISQLPSGLYIARVVGSNSTIMQFVKR